MNTAVTARTIILDPKGHMLIVRRGPSDPLKPGSWDLPGGRVEPNEIIEAAAIRETTEEVGCVVRDLQLIFATSDMREGRSKSWLFFVAAMPKDTTVTLGDEHDDYRWVPPSELNQYTDYDILLRLHDFITRNDLLVVSHES